MNNQIKKDDSALWQLVERAKEFQRAMGITEPPFSLDEFIGSMQGSQETLISLNEQSKHYFIITEPTESDGFIACCPAVEYCTATASTKELAKEALINEISSRLKEMAKKGQPLPIEQGTVEVVEISV